MDLAQVEGLADLLQAETEAQRIQALAQMEGDLSKLYRKWTDELKKCLANVEAFIDFSEDQGIEETILGTGKCHAPQGLLFLLVNTFARCRCQALGCENNFRKFSSG